MRISDWSSDVCSSDLTKCRNHFRLVVDDGRLIEDVLHGGSSADSTLRLQRSNRNGRDVERNLRTDDPRLDDVPVGAAAGGKQTRSEGRRGGKGGVSTCRSRWAPFT